MLWVLAFLGNVAGTTNDGMIGLPGMKITGVCGVI